MNLLEDARKFVAIGETAFAGLAIALVEIEERELWRETEYDSFTEFYTKDLGREKSTISRLRTAGEVLIAAGYSVDRLPSGNLSYRKLAYAKNQLPDEDPKKLVSTALTLSYGEIMDERADKKFGPAHQHQILGTKRWGECECGKHLLDHA